ncbi:hypothetical protein KA005_16005 [bacterium]|nr:hypothetical protein [bacterium]
MQQLDKDADRLDNERVKLGTKVEQIIIEQEAVVKASEKGIEMINSDLKAMRRRLAPYVSKKPRKANTTYYELKAEYETKLQERTVLQNALQLAEESIVAAKLHMIPGE